MAELRHPGSARHHARLAVTLSHPIGSVPLMFETKTIAIQQAVDFKKIHWPIHNRRQGIDWQQQDFAIGSYDNDECRGVAIYKVVGGMAYLEQIVVADAHTHRGIGSSLMRAFEAHAADLGCHVVQLETAETQAPGFYERHGYQRIGTYPNGRFHLDWHLYRKEL
jgi:ribosomal protein S18 acetylase RimI-like enzyme